MIRKAKGNGNALGIDVSQDEDETIAFSFNGGPKVSVAAVIDGCRAETGDDEKDKLALALCPDGKELILQGSARKLLKVLAARTETGFAKVGNKALMGFSMSAAPRGHR